LSGQNKYEGAALHGIVFRPYLPTMRVNDVFRDRQAKAGAVGRKSPVECPLMKFVEDCFEILSRDSGSRIADGDFQLTFERPGRDFDPSGFRRKLDGVSDQVSQRLENSFAI